MTPPPAIHLHDLSVPFGEAAGLEGLSLRVGAGERMVLVGASGAGKTTLLRAVAGLARVAGGRVEIGGRDCTTLPPERRDAVYLHQTPLLFPHLDVFENVAFPLRVRRVGEAEVRARVGSVLDAVRLGEYAARRPRSLSGGQRHRVALARAVIARPAVLLLDEPLSSLDPSLRDEVRSALLTLLARHPAALLLVTHDLDEAGLLAHRVGVLVDRRLAQVAPPAELFAAPATLAVARFLGFENEVPGRVTGSGAFECALGTLPAPLTLPAGPAVAVFRPEALRSDPAGPLRGRLSHLLHRPHRTTARVAVGALALEAAVDALSPPAAGSEAAFTLDARRVHLFPTPGPRGDCTP